MGYVQFEKRPYKCVETGLVHFWCNFLGTKKTYKIETQFLVGFLERKDRDYVATLHDPLCSLMLKDFAKGKPLEGIGYATLAHPLCSPQGPCKQAKIAGLTM